MLPSITDPLAVARRVLRPPSTIFRTLHGSSVSQMFSSNAKRLILPLASATYSAPRRSRTEVGWSSSLME